ncbi:MAG: LysR family transcriptional regulator [Bryobacteraceae bacterium]
MTNIDLRVLAIVSEVSRTRSVSQAAENLALSQSAVSMSLAKLRRHFNDPLFVRTSSGMEPTPHAVDLIQLLQKAEGLLQTALGHHVVFDPKTSDRRFTIHGTDIAQVTFMPPLMKRLGAIAPGIRIDLRRMSDATSKLLESGEADICVGFVPPMGAGYCQQRLFKERFVCAVRADHPRIGAQLDLDAYLSETHLAVATSGTGHSILEKTLETRRLRRTIGLTLPSFLGLTPVLSSLDYIATLPERLALNIAQSTPIKIFPLPVPMPPYIIVQQWHERYTHDPASRWLRSLIAELFTTNIPVSTQQMIPARAAHALHQ